MRSKRGFTLIELLIVVIIIGVLATLAIPRYTTFVEKARAAEALTMITALKTGESVYKAETGTYTNNMSNLNIENVYLTDAAASAAGQLWYYSIVAADNTGYAISASRSYKAGGSSIPAAQYIQITWSDTAGATWTGSHPGKPK